MKRNRYAPVLKPGWYVFHRGFPPLSGPHKTEDEAKKRLEEALKSGLDIYIGRVP